MIFDWNVDLLCVYDGGAVAVGEDEGLLHVPVDLEQVAAHLADLWNIRYINKWIN